MVNVLGGIALAALCAGFGWYCGTHAKEWKEAASRAKDKRQAEVPAPVATVAPKTVQRKLTKKEKKALRERGKSILQRRDLEKQREKKEREAREKAILEWKPEVRCAAPVPVLPRRKPSLFWSFLALGAAVHFLGAHPKKDDAAETEWLSSPWMSAGGDTCDMAGGSGALGNDCGVDVGAGDGDFLTGDTLTGGDSGFGGGDVGGE